MLKRFHSSSQVFPLIGPVGGSFVFCLIIVVILIGLGRAYRSRDFKVMKWGGWGGGGGKPQRDATIFMGEVDPLRHQQKILIWQL